MKIVYCANYYPGYLSYFENKYFTGKEFTYSERLQKITDDHFGVFGSYAEYAGKAGNEAFLIISNYEPLQKQWALENGFEYSESNWNFEILKEQVKRLSPDIFFIGSMFEYYGSFLESIRPYCRRIYAWISCALSDKVQLNQFDLILSSLPDYVQKFRQEGINAELLSAAFDTSLLSKIDSGGDRPIRFSFVGGLSQSHSRRYELIRNVADKTPFQWYGYHGIKLNSFKARVKAYLKGDMMLLNKYQGEAWGLQMFRILNQSKISFNAHIDIATGHRVNLRMFEATGMGSLLLSDEPVAQGLTYFKNGNEIITYRSAKDAIDKVRYFLRHDNERREIAMAGQAKTINNFSYEKNIEKMLEYFKKYI